MASTTMTAEVQKSSTFRSLLPGARSSQTYWDSLAADVREQCINREASRKLCDYEAFDPAGPMRAKWDTEIYPRIRNVLVQERTTIFRRARTEVSYGVHLYMIERQAEFWPAFVAICINLEVGKEIVKVVKKCLKDQSIGLKYLVFKSLLSPTGQQLNSKNVCGLALDFSVRIYGDGEPENPPCAITSVGGCILVGDEAFGLTAAHSLASAPSIIDGEIESPNEIIWVSDSDEEGESRNTESSTSLVIPEISEMSGRENSDGRHPIWEVSISNLTRDTTLKTLQSMLSFKTSLLSVEILHTEITERSRFLTGIARYSDAVSAALTQTSLDGTPNAARDASLHVVLRQIAFVDSTLDLSIYDWTEHRNIGKRMPLSTDDSSLISHQSNLRDDWLLVPLKRSSSIYCNSIPLLNHEGKVLSIRGILSKEPSDQEIFLCLGVSHPCTANLRTTKTGLYLPSARSVIDVYTCDQKTAAGDSGSWVVDSEGYVVGSVLATCENTFTNSYIAPMIATVRSIEHHNTGLMVTFPARELRDEPIPDSRLTIHAAEKETRRSERSYTFVKPIETRTVRDRSNKSLSRRKRPWHERPHDKDTAAHADVLSEDNTTRISVNAQGGRYYGSLYDVSRVGDTSIVQNLLKAGADVNAQEGHYGNALQTALARGHQGVVQMLLDAGADVKAQGGYYGNALQTALACGQEGVVQMLLDAGADVKAQGGYYGNALQAASACSHEGVVQMLLDAGADVKAQGGYHGNALQAASARGHKEIVQMLLDAGADVNAQGGHYGNALQAASACSHEGVVQMLLDAGADVKAQGGYYGNALQAASAFDNMEVVGMLLDAGVDVEAQGGYYGNALQAASARGHKEMVQMLLDAGADINAQGGHYGNALQAASASGYQEVVEMLLHAGVDVEAQGGYYGNALQPASARGHKEVVQMLLEAGAGHPDKPVT